MARRYDSPFGPDLKGRIGLSTASSRAQAIARGSYKALDHRKLWGARHAFPGDMRGMEREKCRTSLNHCQ